jgi:hypothetical protein
MKTREEVVHLIKNQFDGATPVYAQKLPWHYGYLELRELLDFIYDGPPTKPEEELNK